MEVDARYLEIDGRRAFVETRGDGPVVVCLHTAGQSGRQWFEVVRDLPQLGWRVVVPDLPGHGRSDLPARGPVDTIEAYAAWVAQLVTALDDRPGAEPVLVAGCSIGAKIALELATSHPELLAGVVAMAADGRNTLLSPNALRRSLEDSTSPSRADRTYLGTLAVCGTSVPEDRARAIADRHRCEDPTVSILDLVAWANHDLTGRAEHITVPVQLAYGSDDFWVRGADVEALAATIPDCRCERLDGVGHYPMEELEHFARLLDGWLRRVSGSAFPT
jgi:pimeloyl-ACP methyl ester carboxylesterase